MLPCASCGADIPEGFNFCGVCGARAAPAGKAEERKVVTVLFCDLVGFTARSDDADPEEVRATIAPYHQLLRREIEAFGGTVEKFIGDAVMAVFGAPTVHEDDPDRAIRAALRILSAIADGDAGLSVRIGINTGEAVVSLGARPEAGEAIVTGDVVNTASRIQGVAPVGGIAVGERAYEAARDAFEWEELEPATVKGKSEPLSLWQPIVARGRFGVDLPDDAPVTPFVGREEERSLLTGALRRVIRNGSTQLVTIVGEPGVGKSRLIGELFRWVEEVDDLIVWRQGRCLPYGEGVTFWALGEIVKAHAGILESDAPEEAATKLEIALRPLLAEEDRAWVLDRLKPLVGLAGSGGDVEQDELFRAWRSFLEAIAATDPFVLVFEDLHWADPSLLAFIEHVAEYATDVPMLIACTARPEIFEKRASWGAGRRDVTTISVPPLDDRDTSILISALLEQAVLPADIHALVLQRAGGNPLYAEEFVRMLKDKGALERGPGGWSLAVEEIDASPPDSVQAIIAARLDTLPAERKNLLQDAAVIGKVFWAGAVASVGERDVDAVRSELHELARKELIRESRVSSVRDESEYAFWHLLVRDVAYAQIPKAARAAKHVAAALWLEMTAGERSTDHADVLAHHYVEAATLAGADGADAAVSAKAGRFLAAAGDRVLAVDAARAVALYDEALTWVPRWSEGWLKTTLSLIDASMSRGDLDRLRLLVADVRDALPAFDDPRLVGEALWRLSGPLGYLEDIGSARKVLTEAIDLLEPATGENVELAKAYAEMAHFFAIEGDPDGVEWADKALRVSSGPDHPAVQVRALEARGISRVFAGDLDAGIDDVYEALRIGRDHGLGREVAIAYNNLGVELWPARGPVAALDNLETGLAFVRSRGLEEATSGLTGSMLNPLFDLGRWEEVIEVARDLWDVASAKEDRWNQGEAGAHLRRVAALRGRPPGLGEDPLTLSRSVGYSEIVALNLFVATDEAAHRREADHVGSLLSEIAGSHLLVANVPDYVAELARAAVVCGHADMIESILASTPTVAPRHQVGRMAAEAVLLEVAGDIEAALVSHREAAAAWESYGSLVESAHSLYGVHRCATALGLDEEAHETFERAEAIRGPLKAPAFTALLGPVVEDTSAAVS